VNEPFVIGISGSIGSGKSLIRHLLAMRGIMPLDADELTHFLLAKGKAGCRQVAHDFGETYLDGLGDVDRARLGMDVFRDPRSLQKLEAILHPLVSQAVRAILQHTSAPFAALEAIKLYSSDLLQMVDSRWFVTVTPAVQRERLKKTRAMDEGAINERLHQQQFPREMSVDHYIENSSRLSDVEKQIEWIWEDMSREIDGFDRRENDLLRKRSIPILSMQEVEAVEPETRETLTKMLPAASMMEADTFLQRVVLSDTFLSPSGDPGSYLVWRFDHFNTLVQVLQTDNANENMLQGLEKLEEQSGMWGGNCVLVELDERSLPLRQELLSMGYQPFTQEDFVKNPFLSFSLRNKGKIGDHLIKTLAAGVWRLIP